MRRQFTVLLVFGVLLLSTSLTALYVEWKAETERDQLCVSNDAAAQLFYNFLTEGSRQFEMRPTTPEGAKQIKEFQADSLVLIREMACNPDNIP